MRCNLLGILLVFVGTVLGRPFYAIADGPCLAQWDFRPQMGYPFDPNDPNGPGGIRYRETAMLGPVPSETFDPNDGAQWLVPVGKLVRTGSMCVEAGWILDSIVVLSSSASMSVAADTAQATWTLSGDALPGPNWAVVKATNRYPNSSRTVVASRTVCVVWFGVLDSNAGPVLGWVAEWLEAS